MDAAVMNRPKAARRMQGEINAPCFTTLPVTHRNEEAVKEESCVTAF